MLRHLHYRTDADALVVSLDSDGSLSHQPAHDEPDGRAPKCRLCRFREMIDEVQESLRPRAGRGPIETAIGLAVPAIEAWCLVPSEHRVSENEWNLGLQGGKPPYTKEQLKIWTYGMSRPSLEEETRRIVEWVRRIVDEGKQPQLEKLFPSGFGTLARDVRAW
ncbi:MAG: hypothetical protein JW818_01735 [Pirellulales bacterium]|nr:hypothetical protein [Pirellulales bacterium]